MKEKTSAPLDGVVVCVSKKLSKKQSELNAMAASLGADFRYLANVFPPPPHCSLLFIICPSERIPVEREMNIMLFVVLVLFHVPFKMCRIKYHK